MADADMANNQPTPEPAREKRRTSGRRRLRKRTLLLLAGPLVVACAAAYLYITGGRYVETEDAYVKADKVGISAQVAGPIAEVDVAENQVVHKGQVLFRIDDASYRVALAQAQAQLAKTRNDIEALKRSYTEKQQELKLAHINAEFAARDFKRKSDLSLRHAISDSQLDDARHALDVAHQNIAVLEQSLRTLRASLGGAPDIPVEQEPSYLDAKAVRDKAALDLAHTVVRAPFAGVASETPEPGQFVTPGQPVMAVVGDRKVWIEANFKETDLAHVRPGQPVTVEVDTYPGHQWRGKVRSISQATGAEFSVLPAQNSSGNWVKVVQRVPVRIAIRGNPDGKMPLRAGMSTSVRIDTGYRRPIFYRTRHALAWLDQRIILPIASAMPTR